MKTISIIIIIVIGSIIGFVIYAKQWWDDITFKADIISLKNKLPSIVLNLITNQKIPLTILVDNNNNAGLNVYNFQISGKYNDKQVFQSDKIDVISIPANAKNHPINFLIELFANTNTVQLAKSVINDEKPVVQLTISLTKFRVTKSFTFDYKID